jgi:3'(2'), 5'-bisphosphate nucleotidase
MTNELEVGVAAVRAAMALCECVRAEFVRRGGSEAIHKQDKSPVTVADFGSQALVCRGLRAAFPHDEIVGEEDSAELRRPDNAAQLLEVVRFVGAAVPDADGRSVCDWIDLGHGEPGVGRYWVLDPIDGTKGFLRSDQYAVALALIEDGQPRLGILGCPLLPHERGVGQLFVSRDRGGAEAYALDGSSLGPVRVSGVERPAEGRMVESVESAHTSHGLSADLRRELAITREPLRMDSQAKYAAVASGDVEIYLRAPNAKTPDYRECVWDHAAGWLAVREAGGRVTDVRGNAIDWSSGRRLESNVGVLATNGHVHDAVLEALNRLL